MTKKLRISKAAKENALLELLHAVRNGREFPDAHSDICAQYDLSVEAGEVLTQEYDALADRFADGKRSTLYRTAVRKPKIYAFSNVRGGGDGIAYAMAEDGTVLGSHWCSNEAYVPHDLGVREGSRPDRHKTYAEHYPDGYEMEFVRADDVKTHPGLTAAFALNQQQAAAETSQS